MLEESCEEVSHKNNISELVEKFPEIKPERISGIYLQHLKKHEGATLRKFIPLIVFRSVKNILKTIKDYSL